MSLTTVYRYRLWCTSDMKYEYVWAETAPTTCPTNTAHTIDADMTTIIEVNRPDAVLLKEEFASPTGGNAKVWGEQVNITQNTTTVINLSWPFPVTILSGNMFAPEGSDGDLIELVVAPDVTVGAIVAPVAPGATVISVSPTVIEHIMVGYYAKLDNGTNQDDLGRVININKDLNQITIETATVHAFSPLTPTYVKMTVKVIENLRLDSKRYYDFGKKKQGGKTIPANIVIRITYTEISGIDKVLRFWFEGIY